MQSFTIMLSSSANLYDWLSSCRLSFLHASSMLPPCARFLRSTLSQEDPDKANSVNHGGLPNDWLHSPPISKRRQRSQQKVWLFSANE